MSLKTPIEPRVGAVPQLDLFNLPIKLKEATIAIHKDIDQTEEEEQSIPQILNEEESREKKSKRLQSKYGITLDEKEALYELQKGKCYILKQPFPIDELVVDHCHQRGVVRGLLHPHANLLLGHAKDSIKTLKSAIEYLELNQQYTVIRGKKSIILSQNIYE